MALRRPPLGWPLCSSSTRIHPDFGGRSGERWIVEQRGPQSYLEPIEECAQFDRGSSSTYTWESTFQGDPNKDMGNMKKQTFLSYLRRRIRFS